MILLILDWTIIIYSAIFILSVASQLVSEWMKRKVICYQLELRKLLLDVLTECFDHHLGLISPNSFTLMKTEAFSRNVSMQVIFQAVVGNRQPSSPNIYSIGWFSRHEHNKWVSLGASRSCRLQLHSLSKPPQPAVVLLDGGGRWHRGENKDRSQHAKHANLSDPASTVHVNTSLL